MDADGDDGMKEEDWVGGGGVSDGQASVEREKIEGVTGWAGWPGRTGWAPPKGRRRRDDAHSASLPDNPLAVRSVWLPSHFQCAIPF